VTTNYDPGSIHVWNIRLIRRQLADLGLDWDMPSHAPEPAIDNAPLRMVVDSGALRGQLEDPKALLAQANAMLAIQPFDSKASGLRTLALMRMQHWKEALASARWNLISSPFDGETLRRLGLIHFKLGQLHDSVASLHRSLACPISQSSQPFDFATAELLNVVAWKCVADPVNLHEPAKALSLALRAVEILPSPMYRNTLGVVYYRLGRHDDAIACLELSAGQQNTTFVAHDLYFLAMCYQKTGQISKAKAFYERAVAADLAVDHSRSAMAELKAFRAEARRTLGLP
jgi:tetratricopeptide (TPR) repeat protein